MPRKAAVILLGAIAATVLVLGLAWLDAPAYAQEVTPPSDAACLGCHVDSNDEIVLPSGEVVSVDVDLAVLAESVHGEHAAINVACTDCHSPVEYVYPHQPVLAETLAEFEARFAENCQRCHMSIDQHNPGHLIPELYDTNEDLPTCTNCHGGHDVEPAEQMAADPVEFCQECHTSYEDPIVAALHAEVVPNLAGDQDCRTCHTDNPATSVDMMAILATDADVEPAADVPFANSQQCVTCHSLLESELLLPSGEGVPLHVTGEVVMDSVHGTALQGALGYEPLDCIDCHDLQGYTTFPHAIEIPEDQRDYSLERSSVCRDCHLNVFEDELDGIHAAHLAAGNRDAATCTDCHGAHNVQNPDEPRQRISQTCGQCHSAINEVYLTSVHGAALIEGDPNVPTCTDCHGVHGIPDPSTALFRLRSPQVCAECHADEELMAQYGISTEVFDTYVADFHGTTVAIFEQTAPDQVPNEAVCYDCHGVHNILPMSDEHSQVMKANLLVTCQQCHPDATENFPDAWMSHFRPSLEHYPLVYLVDLFYDILIPLVLGGFLVFVVGDASRRLVNRRQSRRETPS